MFYPVPLYKQKAFSRFAPDDLELANTEALCESVISLPVHTEMDAETQNFIIESVKSFFLPKTHAANDKSAGENV